MSCPNQERFGHSPLPSLVEHDDEGGGCGGGGGGGLELEQRQKQHLLPSTANTELNVIPHTDHDLLSLNHVDVHQNALEATGVVAAETSFDSDEENNGLPSKQPQNCTISDDLIVPAPPPLHTSQPSVPPSMALRTNQGIKQTTKDLFGEPLPIDESRVHDDDQFVLSDVCLDETVLPWVQSAPSPKVISTPSRTGFPFSFEQGGQHDAPVSRIVSPDNGGSIRTASPLLVASGGIGLVAQDTASTLSRDNHRHQQASRTVVLDQHYAPTVGFQPSVTVPLAQQEGLRRRRMDPEADDAPCRIATVQGQESVGAGFASSSTSHSSEITPSIVINSYNNMLASSSLDGRPQRAPLPTSESFAPEQMADDRSPLSGPHNRGSGHHHTPPTEVGLEGAAQAPRPHRRWEWNEGCLKIMFVVASRIADLFSIGESICWVLMAGFSLVSTNTSCEVPLKSFFWLVTLQKLLRFGNARMLNRWSENPESRGVFRLMVFNIILLAYSCCVTSFGLYIAMTRHDGNCPRAFFRTATAFVCLSIARWCSVVLGMVVPICYLPIRNSQRPTMEVQVVHLTIAVARPGAPPGCIDRMQVIPWNDLLDSHPRECCICMGNFASEDVIVTTTCHHVFHKSCCQDWLLQARTCPVCRADIPGSLGIHDVEQSDDDSTLDMEASALLSSSTLTDATDRTNDFPRIFHALRQHDERIRILQRQQNRSNDLDQSTEHVPPAATGSNNEDDSQGNVNFVLIRGPQVTARSPSAMNRGSSGNDRSGNNDGTATTGTHPLPSGDLAARLNNLSEQERSDVSFRLLLCALRQRQDRLRRLLQQDRASGGALLLTNTSSVVVLGVREDNRGRLQFVAIGASNRLARTHPPVPLGAAPPLTTRPPPATGSANQFSRLSATSGVTPRDLSGRISQQGSFPRMTARPVNLRVLHNHRSSHRRGVRTSAAIDVPSDSYADGDRVVAFPSLLLQTEPLQLSLGVALSNNAMLSSMEEGRADDQAVLA